MLIVALTQIFAIGGMMSWNKNAAVSYIRSHANSSSQNNCVRYTRDAIAAGGLNLVYTLQARNYGGPLINAGFVEISPSSALIAGDIAIIQPCAGGNSAGHMQCMTVPHGFQIFVNAVFIRVTLTKVP